MSNYSIFVSVSDVKFTGYVDGNVDDELIRKIIYTAQQMHILPILGTALYDKLATDIAAGTLASPYTTLATKLKPAIVWATMVEGVYPFAIKIRNKGIMTQGGDNTQNIDFSELNSLMDFFKDRMEEFLQRVTMYLIENQTSFTEYMNAGTGADTIHPDKNSYTTTWHLDRDNGCSMRGGPDSTIDI